MMVFIGQAIASTTMSCLSEVTQSQHEEQMMDSFTMDHSQHMSLNDADSLSPSDCCPDCDCCLGGCVTAIVTSFEQGLVSSLSFMTNDYVSLAEKQLTSSLYRPPISR
jgi:hypothetical protein